MKTMVEIEKIISENREKLKNKFNVKSIGIFGSYVRNEQNNESDIDILIDFYEPVGFFTFLDIEEYLENLLEVNVDLVTPKALKPYIGKKIIEEVVYI